MIGPGVRGAGASGNRRLLRPMAVIAIGCVLLAALALTSLATGLLDVTLPTVMTALLHPDPSSAEHAVVLATRLPRTVVALAAGAGLAVAGALMQALTRNSLASPGLFGVNGGAMLALASAACAGWTVGASGQLWLAFAGAAAAGALVYGLGGAGRGPHARLVLAGAAVAALCTALTQALLVIDQEGLDGILFWIAGSVAARDLDTVLPMLPWLAMALLASCLMARHVDVLAAGDEIAAGLGQRTGLAKAGVSLAVVVLSGVAVGIAGSIGFIGLIVPHAMRRLVGHGHRWLLPACALYGACLLLAADVASRPLATGSLPIGVLTALLGAPVFLTLLRRGWRDG
jgi:iron complex transport system permease protein